MLSKHTLSSIYLWISFVVSTFNCSCKSDLFFVQWLNLRLKKAMSITPEWLFSQAFGRIWFRKEDLWHVTLIGCLVICFRVRPEHRPARNLTREEMATLVLVISLRIDTILVSLSKIYFETCQTSMIWKVFLPK